MRQDASDRLLYVDQAAFDVSAPSAERRFGDLGYNTLSWTVCVHLGRGPSQSFALQVGSPDHFPVSRRSMCSITLCSAIRNNVYTNPNFGRILTASDGRSIQLGVGNTSSEPGAVRHAG